MVSILRYGTDSSINFAVSNGNWLAECGSPHGKPLHDLPAAVAQALAEPLDYPALASCTTPTDRVVLALDQGVPQAPTIVAGVVRAVVESGVAPDAITVLRTKVDADAHSPDPRQALPEPLRDRVSLETHDPENRGRMAYLAVAEDGEPIVLNRTIVDGDLVIPIGAISNHRAAIYHGIYGAVFPAFSDQKTLLRFRSPDLLRNGTGQKKQLLKQCNEAGWLLGVNFTLQVVPGAGEEVLHVLAGQAGPVRSRGWELYQAAWTSSAPSPASLVVAAIEGDARHQTWQNVGQALAVATPLVEDGGAIALCCTLAAEPGPAVQRLSGDPSRHDALRQIRRELPEDALPAVQLARALDRSHVYLLSRLEPSVVEELNIAPLDGPQAVVRLAQRYPSCILLANAPQALVTLEG